MAKDRTYEGKIVAGDKVKVLGAAGLRTDVEVPGDGVWVEVTIRGRSGAVTHDPQKNGWVREVDIHASPQHCEVQIMDEAPPEMEGQAKLEEAEPNLKAVRDDQGQPVEGPQEA